MLLRLPPTATKGMSSRGTSAVATNVAAATLTTPGDPGRPLTTADDLTPLSSWPARPTSAPSKPTSHCSSATRFQDRPYTHSVAGQAWLLTQACPAEKSRPGVCAVFCSKDSLPFPMTLARRFPHLKPFLDHDGGSPDFWQIAVLDLGLLSSNRERTHSFQVVTMNYK